MKFWNYKVDSERFCLYIKSYFFPKRRLKKLFFFRKPKNPSKKNTSANFRINEVNCGKIQDQFVISVLKTGITNWSQIWCLCLTILELLKTQHCGVASIHRIDESFPLKPSLVMLKFFIVIKLLHCKLEPFLVLILLLILKGSRGLKFRCSEKAIRIWKNLSLRFDMSSYFETWVWIICFCVCLFWNFNPSKAWKQLFVIVFRRVEISSFRRVEIKRKSRWFKLNSQNSIISFGYVDFYAKIFLILYTPFENSTTRTAIPGSLWLHSGLVGVALMAHAP